MAVDANGQIATSTDPTGGRRAWRPTVVDPNANQPAPGFPPAGVSCPTSSFCAVVDNGQVYTSAVPTAGPRAWRIAHADPGFLSSVSYPTPAECVAVDYAGNAVVGR